MSFAPAATRSRPAGGRHNVRIHRTAHKRLHNPVVGDIELTGDVLELPGEGLTLIAYTADVGSNARDQLDLLASWSATERPTSAPATAAQPERSDTTPNRGTP